MSSDLVPQSAYGNAKNSFKNAKITAEHPTGCSAVIFIGVGISALQLCQRLIEIVQQVIGVLKAGGEANLAHGDANSRQVVGAEIAMRALGG